MDNVTIGGISLSENNYLVFRKAYRKAVAAGQEEFRCFDQVWLVSFAKYVLECMETYAIIKPVIDGDD